MRVYDMHIHDDGSEASGARLLEKMEAAGIYGGAVFSIDPMRGNLEFEQRYDHVMQWADGGQGRIFPVMFVHPDEPDIAQKCLHCVKEGITGFKMICQNYFVYDPKSLELIRAIATTGKPIFFHSGILWSGDPSSAFNRPATWEYLIDIPGLKFSLAHGAWPWVDECIAVYGKFLNSYARGTGSSEMFFDVTPGTPPIYRRDLWYKLFHVGYDVPHNIMYGTDSRAGVYDPGWIQSWLKMDTEIFDEMGVSEHLRELIFEKNFMRFMGLAEKDFTHKTPIPDNSNAWSLKDIP